MGRDDGFSAAACGWSLVAVRFVVVDDFSREDIRAAVVDKRISCVLPFYSWFGTGRGGVSVFTRQKHNVSETAGDVWLETHRGTSGLDWLFAVPVSLDGGNDRYPIRVGLCHCTGGFDSVSCADSDVGRLSGGFRSSVH